jgi:exosortase
MKNKNLVKSIVLSALTIITYIPTFIWMVNRWTSADSYYSHGFLVPFVSAFIVWLKRNKLNKLSIKPSNSGWLLFILGALIHLVSAILRVYFTSGFSFILVASGLILIFLGRDHLKELAFPICFLIFMIPLPLIAVANLSFKLKIFAAHISTILINKIGIPAVREGSIIKTMHAYIIVEDPCSGIRSLIALIALGALMAYFSNISRLRKGLLFLSSIPIAITSNVIRIVTLSTVTEIYGPQWATGIFETIMGTLVFAFAFLGLIIVGKVLE